MQHLVRPDCHGCWVVRERVHVSARQKEICQKLRWPQPGIACSNPATIKPIWLGQIKTETGGLGPGIIALRLLFLFGMKPPRVMFRVNPLILHSLPHASSAFTAFAPLLAFAPADPSRKSQKLETNACFDTPRAPWPWPDWPRLSSSGASTARYISERPSEVW